MPSSRVCPRRSWQEIPKMLSQSQLQHGTRQRGGGGGGGRGGRSNNDTIKNQSTCTNENNHLIFCTGNSCVLLILTSKYRKRSKSNNLAPVRPIQHPWPIKGQKQVIQHPPDLSDIHCQSSPPKFTPPCNLTRQSHPL